VVQKVGHSAVGAGGRWVASRRPVVVGEARRGAGSDPSRQRGIGRLEGGVRGEAEAADAARWEASDQVRDDIVSDIV